LSCEFKTTRTTRTQHIITKTSVTIPAIKAMSVDELGTAASGSVGTGVVMVIVSKGIFAVASGMLVVVLAIISVVCIVVLGSVGTGVGTGVVLVNVIGVVLVSLVGVLLVVLTGVVLVVLTSVVLVVFTGVVLVVGRGVVLVVISSVTVQFAIKRMFLS